MDNTKKAEEAVMTNDDKVDKAPISDARVGETEIVPTSTSVPLPVVGGNCVRFTSPKTKSGVRNPLKHVAYLDNGRYMVSEMQYGCLPKPAEHLKDRVVNLFDYFISYMREHEGILTAPEATHSGPGTVEGQIPDDKFTGVPIEKLIHDAPDNVKQENLLLGTNINEFLRVNCTIRPPEDPLEYDVLIPPPINAVNQNQFARVRKTTTLNGYMKSIPLFSTTDMLNYELKLSAMMELFLLRQDDYWLPIALSMYLKQKPGELGTNDSSTKETFYHRRLYEGHSSYWQFIMTNRPFLNAYMMWCMDKIKSMVLVKNLDSDTFVREMTSLLKIKLGVVSGTHQWISQLKGDEGRDAFVFLILKLIFRGRVNLNINGTYDKFNAETIICAFLIHLLPLGHFSKLTVTRLHNACIMFYIYVLLDFTTKNDNRNQANLNNNVNYTKLSLHPDRVRARELVDELGVFIANNKPSLVAGSIDLLKECGARGWLPPVMIVFFRNCWSDVQISVDELFDPELIYPQTIAQRRAFRLPSVRISHGGFLSPANSFMRNVNLQIYGGTGHANQFYLPTPYVDLNLHQIPVPAQSLFDFVVGLIMDVKVTNTTRLHMDDLVMIARVLNKVRDQGDATRSMWNNMTRLGEACSFFPNERAHVYTFDDANDDDPLLAVPDAEGSPEDIERLNLLNLNFANRDVRRSLPADASYDPVILERTVRSRYVEMDVNCTALLSSFMLLDWNDYDEIIKPSVALVEECLNMRYNCHENVSFYNMLHVTNGVPYEVLIDNFRRYDVNSAMFPSYPFTANERLKFVMDRVPIHPMFTKAYADMCSRNTAEKALIMVPLLRSNGAIDALPIGSSYALALDGLDMGQDNSSYFCNALALTIRFILDNLTFFGVTDHFVVLPPSNTRFLHRATQDMDIGIKVEDDETVYSHEDVLDEAEDNAPTRDTRLVLTNIPTIAYDQHMIGRVMKDTDMILVIGTGLQRDLASEVKQLRTHYGEGILTIAATGLPALTLHDDDTLNRTPVALGMNPTDLSVPVGRFFSSTYLSYFLYVHQHVRDLIRHRDEITDMRVAINKLTFFGYSLFDCSEYSDQQTDMDVQSIKLGDGEIMVAPRILVAYTDIRHALTVNASTLTNGSRITLARRPANLQFKALGDYQASIIAWLRALSHRTDLYKEPLNIQTVSNNDTTVIKTADLVSAQVEY